MSSIEHRHKTEEHDAFFAPIEEKIVMFSQRFNLRVAKYRHSAPVWEFHCRHPKGGIASVALHRGVPDNEVVINSNWFIDDFDRLERSVWFSDSVHLDRDSLVVDKELAPQLRQVLTLSTQALRKAGHRYEHWQDRLKQIKADQLSYPTPTNWQ